MTNEELVLKIKTGETSLLDTLWTQTNKFTYKQACKFYHSYTDRCRQLGLDVDDLYQESFFALTRAVEGYNEEIGTTFLTYAGYHLKKCWFSLSKMNYSGWQNNTVYQAQSLDAPAYKDNPETTLGDTLVGSDNTEEYVLTSMYNSSFRDDVSACVIELPSTWADILSQVYVDQTRLADIARQQNLSRVTVGQKHQRALKYLRLRPEIQAYRVC